MKRSTIKMAVLLLGSPSGLGCAANWWYVLYVLVGLLILCIFVYVIYKLYWYCKGIRHARAYAAKSKEMCAFCYKQTISSNTAIEDRESSRRSSSNTHTAAASARLALPNPSFLLESGWRRRSASADSTAARADALFRCAVGSFGGNAAESIRFYHFWRDRRVKPSRIKDRRGEKRGCAQTTAEPVSLRASADCDPDSSEEALRSTFATTRTGVGEIRREVVY